LFYTKCFSYNLGLSSLDGARHGKKYMHKDMVCVEEINQK